MPPRYWMVTDREVLKEDFGDDEAPRDQVSYWTSSAGALDRFSSWKHVSEKRFAEQLLGAAGAFPAYGLEENERQKHVSLFVHGYNNSWQDAAKRYQSLNDTLFEQNDLGLCVLFAWPSNGTVTGYLPDRSDAERSGPHLARVLGRLYDWLLQKQGDCAADPRNACKAKTSLIAHSMGNYVLQKAMQFVWTRKNQPLLMSLINQLIMVAADVDNDLFKSGEAIEKGDGDAIANLTYRVTALYTGLDSVLGLSAGLKHFGKRRLGRSGLDGTYPVPDNVWHYDCTPFLTGKPNTHSAYFETKQTLDLMRDILRGFDRGLIASGLSAFGVPASTP